MTEIVDFDKVIPEKRIAKIAGKEIDVSRLPARLVLEQAKFSDDLKSGKIRSMADIQRRSFETVERVCKLSDPDFNLEDIIDDITVEQLLQFIEFVLEPLNSRSKDKDKKKLSPEK